MRIKTDSSENRYDTSLHPHFINSNFTIQLACNSIVYFLKNRIFVHNLLTQWTMNVYWFWNCVCHSICRFDKPNWSSVSQSLQICFLMHILKLETFLFYYWTTNNELSKSDLQDLCRLCFLIAGFCAHFRNNEQIDIEFSKGKCIQ